MTQQDQACFFILKRKPAFITGGIFIIGKTLHLLNKYINMLKLVKHRYYSNHRSWVVQTIL
jgi:hypothetical protein